MEDCFCFDATNLRIGSRLSADKWYNGLPNISKFHIKNRIFLADSNLIIIITRANMLLHIQTQDYYGKNSLFCVSNPNERNEGEIQTKRLSKRIFFAFFAWKEIVGDLVIAFRSTRNWKKKFLQIQTT